MTRANGKHIDDDQQELVAYLDGELDLPDVHRIEQRLSQDDGYHQQLQLLQRSWDLLDELPVVQPDESFTRTTVEMVAVTAQRDTKIDQRRQRSRARYDRLGWVLSILLAAVAGFLVVSSWLQRSERALLQDLPVIENVDLYQLVDDDQFLNSLDQEGLFADEVDDGN